MSDHVKCFYCGNGLRNWEDEDNPWEEHAYWYPNCNYVNIVKGFDFIEKVSNAKPQKLVPSSGKFKRLSDDDLEILTKELDVTRYVKDMDFSYDKIREALKNKLERTGIPFFTLDSCIEAILNLIREEQPSAEITTPSSEKNSYERLVGNNSEDTIYKN